MRRIVATMGVLLLPVLAAACGGGNSPGSSSGGGGCAAASGSSGNGAHVTIGSKAFAEEELMAEMTKEVLQAHGFTVDFSFQAKDKAIGQALSGGQIDMYWQYVGTELTTYLNLSGFPTEPTAAFNYVQQQDVAHGICWNAQTPFNDTNGLAIKASDKATYGDSLSAFGTYLASHPGTKVCILSEFRTRPDGLPGLEKTYNAAYSQATYIDQGSTAEKSVAAGQCAAGEVFTTDSAIGANNLYVLTDDKSLFPPDNAGLLVRQSVQQANPAIGALMAPVAAKWTSDTMIALNQQVEIQNKKVSDVAHKWLVDNGFLTS